MKALSYDRFGPVDLLRLADRPEPTVRPGDVLVSVRASSLNVIDGRVRAGVLGPLVRKDFPKISGADVAGVVAAVGSAVREFAVGDRVFGAVDPFRGGAHAERVAVPAAQLAPLPAALDFERAAALPITGLAALQSLRDLARVRSGERLLVHGGSGGYGLFAIQLARTYELEVTAVAGSDAGLAAVRAAGAETLIDYRAAPAERFAQVFDVILNASGRLPYALARQSLAPHGRLVEPSPTIPLVIGTLLLNPFRRCKHLPLMTKIVRRDLEHLAELTVRGTLRPSISSVVPFVDAPPAIRAFERGGTVGKVVVAF
jgi:NADPH:quinone reductase-like Zn-dependent oxidoreductase